MDQKKEVTIHSGKVSKLLLVTNITVALLYFSWWFFPAHVGNPVLYALLFIGEMYHIIMAFAFWYTLWPKNNKKAFENVNMNLADKIFSPSVDIFITVAGEPIEIVRKTVKAAQSINYTNCSIYILNDGYVAKKENWKDMESLALELNVVCITRQIGGGAKAGNINHALKQTHGEFLVVFDSDMVPHTNFLEKVIPYFKQENVGFVQTPQYYNNALLNEVTGGAWDQQEFFFGPIMRGKANSNSAFICGTNVAIRRTAIQEVGGMFEKNIAEDFLTSLFIHQKKWHSYYVPEVLCEGLAPEDLLSYYKQQLRWARGSLEVLFTFNPLFKKGLTFGQKIQYLSSALYYFNGVIVLIDILMPVLFFFFGAQPVAASTTSFALFFVPYMFLSLYTLYTASERSITFRAISFSQASWTLQLSALKSVLLKEKSSFAVTPKQAQTGNFFFLVYPHIAYIALVIIGTCIGMYREGFNSAIVTNLAWTFFNVSMFIPFIKAAYPWKKVLNNTHTLKNIIPTTL